MEPEETAAIVRLVKSVFPQQPIDRATYDTWHLVIGHLDHHAAQAAVLAIAHSEKFCSAADIIREAGRAAKSHPSSRTVAEALESANRRELGAAGPTPPGAEFLKAKDALVERMKARDEAAYLTDRAAERKAAAWIDGAVRGRQPVDEPLMAPAGDRWAQLPGDPPGLRAWLARQPRDATSREAADRKETPDD